MNETPPNPAEVEVQKAQAIPITRIYIDAEGNLVITDLWESMRKLVTE